MGQQGEGGWGGDAEVDRLLREGLKIDAIKHVRTVTGWGLREAKDWAEQRFIELAEERERDPLPFAPSDPEVDQLIRDGRKIEAVKLVRERRGSSLHEAKALVDQRQLELARYGARTQDRPLRDLQGMGHDPWEDSVLGEADEDPAAEVLALVRRGQKIEAIKLVRTLYKCGLLEAKQWVEAVESGGRPPPPTAKPPPEAPPSAWPGQLPSPPKAAEKAPEPKPEPKATTVKPDPKPAMPPRETPLPGGQDSPYQTSEARPWWKFW